MHINQRKDYYAGALMALIGAVSVYSGFQYGLGTLQQMGAGYFPVLLGVLLLGCGAMICGFAGRERAAQAGTTVHQSSPTRFDYRSWLAIISAVIVFIAVAQSLGLAPATFACVLIAALGDRQATWRASVVLALGVTIFGVLLFAFGLKVQLPIVRGLDL